MYFPFWYIKINLTYEVKSTSKELDYNDGWIYSNKSSFART